MENWIWQKTGNSITTKLLNLLILRWPSKWRELRFSSPKAFLPQKRPSIFLCPTGDEGSSSFGFMGQTTSQAKMLSLLYTVWCDLRKRIVTNAHPLLVCCTLPIICLNNWMPMHIEFVWLSKSSFALQNSFFALSHYWKSLIFLQKYNFDKTVNLKIFEFWRQIGWYYSINQTKK